MDTFIFTDAECPDAPHLRQPEQAIPPYSVVRTPSGSVTWWQSCGIPDGFSIIRPMTAQEASIAHRIETNWLTDVTWSAQLGDMIRVPV